MYSLLTAPTTSSRLPPMEVRLTAQLPVAGVTTTVPSLGPRSPAVDIINIRI